MSGEQDCVSVGAAAGLVDRERPVVWVAEVADAAEPDLVAVVFAEVAGEVAVGAAPGDGDLFQGRPASGGVVVDGAFDGVFEGLGRHGQEAIVARAGAPPPDLILFRQLSGDLPGPPEGKSGKGWVREGGRIWVAAVP